MHVFNRLFLATLEPQIHKRKDHLKLRIMFGSVDSMYRGTIARESSEHETAEEDAGEDGEEVARVHRHYSDHAGGIRQLWCV